MSRSSEKRRFRYISAWLQEGLFCLGCLIYLMIRIHPIHVLELHPPVFFIDLKFFEDFLSIPGGMTDWFSALCMKFWLSDLLTALFLTFCFWIVAFLTKKWIETLTDHRPIHTFHLIPAGILLVLHSQYDFTLSITLSLIINLLLLNIFIRWAPTHQAIRVVFGIVVSIFLYWVTGGAFLMFVVLCGLSDILFRKQIVNGLFLLILLPVLPYLLSTSIFLVSLEQAYLHNLVIEDVVNPWMNYYSLPVFFLLTLIVTILVKVSAIRESIKELSERTRLKKVSYIWRYAAGFLFVVGGTFLLAQKIYDRPIWLILEINRSIKENRWSDVLKLTSQSTSVNPLISFHTNTALFHTGVLLDRMFMYPQPYGTAGLIMNFEWCSAWPEEASNMYWKFGLVSESQHWAHEAFEQKGYTSDLLKRLGLVYMIKGDHEAAKRYFLKLKKIPFEEKTAEYLIRLNEKPSEIAQDSALNYIQLCMLRENFILSGNPSLLQLELLLRTNPQNKMVFEYLIAYHLLSGDLQALISRIPDFEVFAYSQIPIHVQEALLIHATMTEYFDQSQIENIIQPLIYKRFSECEQILRKHKGNIYSAKPELQTQFGNTYLYYLMYVKPTPPPPERPY